MFLEIPRGAFVYPGAMVDDLARGLTGLEESRSDYLEAERYYEGKVDEIFTSAAIRRLVDSLGSSFRLNFASIPVDKLIARVKFAGASVVGSDSLTDSLTELLEEQGVEAEMITALKWSLVFGDAYLIGWPSDDDPDTDAIEKVEVFYNSPLVVRAMYDEENPRKVRYYVKAWRSGKRSRANLYYPDRIERYITKVDATEKKVVSYRAEDYEEYLDATSAENPEDDGEFESDIPNEWDRLPAVHIRHNDDGGSYGTPAHKKAYGAQDAITKIIATEMSSFESQGFPARVAIENPDTDSDLGEDFDDDEETEVGKRKSKIELDPGTITVLKNIKEVAQFEGADPKNFLEPAEFYIRSIGLLTDTPAYEFDINGEQPSGESRKRADAPIQAHAKDFTDSNTRRLETFFSVLLAMLGNGDQKVSLTWQTAEVASDTDSWAVVALKIASGVPLRVALKEAGYDDDVIAEWYPEDTPAYSPEQLAKLADAIGKLGNAVTLGAIDQAAVVALLPGLFVEARTEPTE